MWSRELIVHDSSQIRAILYRSTDSVMRVEFVNGDIYEYMGISPFDFGELAGSDSVGKRFAKVKSTFGEYRKVES